MSDPVSTAPLMLGMLLTSRRLLVRSVTSERWTVLGPFVTIERMVDLMWVVLRRRVDLVGVGAFVATCATAL